MRPQSLGLLSGQLKDEIGREALAITSHLLVEALGGNAVEGSELCVEQHPPAPQGEDGAGDVVRLRCRPEL